jgi:hypothetical protein
MEIRGRESLRLQDSLGSIVQEVSQKIMNLSSTQGSNLQSSDSKSDALTIGPAELCLSLIVFAYIISLFYHYILYQINGGLASSRSTQRG